MSDTQQNNDIKKGKNIVVIQNLGDTNKRISISLSYFSKNYFEDPEYSDFSNPNLILTAKSIQSCLTPYVDDLIDCTNASKEVSLFLNPNSPFNVEIDNVNYSFKDANDFINSSALPFNISKDIVQTYTKTPTNECTVSLKAFKPFMLELDNNQFKFYSIEELYEQEETLKKFNIVLKVLSK